MKKYLIVLLALVLAGTLGCRPGSSISTFVKPGIEFGPAPVLGILALTSNSPESGIAISDAIGSGLVMSDFTIVERTQLNRILGEHGFVLSGLTSDIDFKKIGKILNVDFVLMGSTTTIEKATTGGTKFHRSTSHL